MIEPGALPAMPPTAVLLGERFASAGFELYLVGGAVRDQALGMGSDIEDLDLTTNARPADTLGLLEPLATAIWRQGERFGTIGAAIDNRSVEVTTYRRESYGPNSRKPEVGFGDDLQTDLSRRDFTINAMAREAVSGTLIDPFNGWNDLVDRRLRTPLAPDVSFQDDPLRMLRAARFGARLGMAFDPELTRAATDLAGRIAIVSGERIATELERLLLLPDPAPGLRFLWETGILSATFEGARLPPFGGVAASVGKIHLQTPADAAVRWAALIRMMHRSAAATSQRLRLSREREQDLTRLLDADLPTATDAPALREALVELGASLTKRIIALQRITGPAENVPLDRFEAAFGDLTVEISREELAPPLSGDDVQRLLKIAPGPAVGAALGALQAHIIAVGRLSVDEAKEFMLGTWPGGEQ